MSKSSNPYCSAEYFMDRLKHIISISKVALIRVPDEECVDSDKCWVEYDIHQTIADSILNQFLDDYQPNTIQIRAAMNESQIGYITFYFKHQCITPRLHYGLVGDDTDLPDILDILGECISQNTANPDLYRRDIVG